MPGTDSGASSAPVFSVIVPLGAHRGQWDRCWRGWAAQTVDASAYEVIVVIPSDFQESALLAGLPANFVQFQNLSHDTDPCAAGAVGARGRYLLFTEAHCSPELTYSNCVLRPSTPIPAGPASHARPCR
jgi:hypothetical protein